MSKKITKLLSMLLAVLLIFTSFVACSKAPVGTEDSQTSEETSAEQQEENSSEEVGEEAEEEEEVVEEPKYDFGGRTIRWAAWWDLGPVEGSSELADLQLERIAQLEEKYNFKLEFLNIPYQELVEQTSASTLAGDPIAEFVQLENRFLLSYIISGLLLPVSDLGVFDFNEDKWEKRVIRDTTWDGKVYGLMTGMKAPENGVLWWNKTMFEREGLPNLYELQNNKQWTWDKMLEIAQKATKDLDGDGVIDQWGLVGFFPELSFIYSNNGFTVKADGTNLKFTLMEPNALEALQFFQDLVHTHKVFALAPSGSEWNWDQKQFAAGKAAMHIDGAWIGGDLEKTMADEYGCVAFPMGPKSDRYTAAISVENYAVMPATVKKPEEAAIFYDEYTEPFEGIDPVESWREGYENNMCDRESVDTLEMLVREQASITVLHNAIQGLEGLIGGAFNQIRTGNKTAKAAVEEISQQAQTTIDDFLSQRK